MFSCVFCEISHNSLTWWYILKTSWRYLCKTSSKRLEDILKMPWRRFCMTSWRRLENVFKASWKYLEDVLKTYRQDEYIGLDQDVLKTSSEDVRLRRTYSSWSRRLEDVFKTSSEDEDERRLQDVFKTSSSRRMFAGKYSGNVVCWAYFFKNDSKPFWIYCSINSGQSFLSFRPGRTIVYFVVIFSLRSGKYCMKNIPFRVFSGLYFPVLGLNTTIHSVNLRIQYQCRKIQAERNSKPTLFTQW